MRKFITYFGLFILFLFSSDVQAQVVITHEWQIIPGKIIRYDWTKTTPGGTGTANVLVFKGPTPADDIQINYQDDQVSFMTKDYDIILPPLSSTKEDAGVRGSSYGGGYVPLPFDHVFDFGRIEKIDYSWIFKIKDKQGNFLAYYLPDGTVLINYTKDYMAAIHPNGPNRLVSDLALPGNEQYYLRQAEGYLNTGIRRVRYSNKTYTDMRKGVMFGSQKPPRDVNLFTSARSFLPSRKLDTCRKLVVFIHGLFGDPLKFKKVYEQELKKPEYECFEYALFTYSVMESTDAVTDRLVDMLKMAASPPSVYDINPYDEIIVMTHSFGGVPAAKAASKLDTVSVDLHTPVYIHTFAAPLRDGELDDSWLNLLVRTPLGTAVGNLSLSSFFMKGVYDAMIGFAPYAAPSPNVKVKHWLTTDPTFSEGDTNVSGQAQNNLVPGAEKVFLGGAGGHQRIYEFIPVVLRTHHACDMSRCSTGIVVPPNPDDPDANPGGGGSGGGGGDPGPSTGNGQPPIYECKKNGQQSTMPFPCNIGSPCSGGNVCDDNCQCVADRCGDAVVDVALGEECDQGPLNGGMLCTTACKKTFCGDGTKNDVNGYGQLEECDDGIDNGPDKLCTEDCKLTYCGDGTVQDPNGKGDHEECDNTLCSKEVAPNTAIAGICMSTCKCNFDIYPQPGD